MGRFIVPSCRKANVETNTIINNSLRINEKIDRHIKEQGMLVDIDIVAEGDIIYSKKCAATIALGESVEFKEKDYDILNTISDKEFAFVFRCYYENYSEHFSQEHQVIYEKKNDTFATVLYDQFPDLKSTPATVHPIILLAPKTWAGKEINTYVTLTNINEGTLQSQHAYPFEVSILNQKGEMVFNKTLTIYNDTYVLDIKATLDGKIDFETKPEFFNVLAKGGGDGSCVINTLVVNETTGNMAVEHSLDPRYYTTGDRDRLRDEALNLENVKAAV